MRTNLSLHNITADDLEAGGGTKAGLHVAANDGQISFGIGRVSLFFDGPTEFAAWLTKLNALAAATREVVEAMESLTQVELQMAAGERYCDVETTTEHDGVFICTRPAGHGGAHAAHITPDMPPVHAWAAAAPVEPGWCRCLEESGGYLCTRPVGHEDEHVASGVHSEHIHGGSVRWPQ